MRRIALWLGLALAAGLASPAAADGWSGRGHGWGHHGHHGHFGHHHRHFGHRHHHGGGVFFRFRPAPRYFHRERRLIVIERPVVVERPVIVQAPPGIALGRQVADGSGRHCREYRTSGRIAGRVEQLWGVACLRPDGSWDLAG